MSVLNFPLAKHWSLKSLNRKQSADYDAAVCALHPVSAVLPLGYVLNLLLMFNGFCIVYKRHTKVAFRHIVFICQLEQTNILGSGYNICSAVSHCEFVSALSDVRRCDWRSLLAQDMSTSSPASASQMGAGAAKEGDDGWDNDDDWGSLDDVPADRVSGVHFFT